MTHGRGTVYPIRNHPKLRERVSSRYGNVTPQQPTLTKKKTFSITLLGTGQTISIARILLLLHHHHLSYTRPYSCLSGRTDCLLSFFCLFIPPSLLRLLILTKQRLLYRTLQATALIVHTLVLLVDTLSSFCTHIILHTSLI